MNCRTMSVLKLLKSFPVEIDNDDSIVQESQIYSTILESRS